MSEVHPNLGQDRLQSALGRPRGGLERPLQRYRVCPVGRRMLCRVSVQGGGRAPIHILGRITPRLNLEIERQLDGHLVIQTCKS